MSRRILIAALVLSAAALGVLAADGARGHPVGSPPLGRDADARTADPPDEVSDWQQVVFFGPTKPMLLRLHVRVNGRPYPLLFDGYVKEMFDFLDRDGDGVLSKEEAERAPNSQTLQERLNGGGLFNAQNNGTATMDDLDTDSDGKVTLDELLAYYHKTGIGFLRIAIGPSQAGQYAEAVNDALFRLLDTNRDGKLSKEELAVAPDLLRLLDSDDDETVSAQELLGEDYRLPDPNQGQRDQPDKVDPLLADNDKPRASFLVVTSDDASDYLEKRQKLVEELITRYDRDRDGKLSAAELGLDQAVFKVLDRNKDGVLDAGELSRWVKKPADVEVTLRLGERADNQPAVEHQPPEKEVEGAAKVASTGSGSVLVSAPDAQVNLRASGMGRGRGQMMRANEQLLQLFKMADSGKKGHLEMADVEKPEFQVLKPIFAVADRNGDGKLTEAELTAYGTLVGNAASSTVSLQVQESGRSLFEMFDTNRDGRLGLRELRTVWDRLALYDKDGSGKVGRAAVPRQYQVAVVQGLGGGGRGRRGMPVPPGTVAVDPGAAPAEGPLWFRKMDTNHDGDISPREWLGTAEEFRRLDTDGDGLISLEEAIAADAAARKQNSEGGK
jgi:Ca2+-binding EF-hand superfamily protein